MRQNIGLAKNFVLVYPYHLMENLNELFGQPNKWAPYHTLLNIWLPRWFSGKESTCQSRRCRLDLWLGKIPWRRKRQPASIFLPGKTLGQRSLTGNSPRSWKGVGHGLVSQFSSVQSLSHVWLFAIPWTEACQASLSIISCWSLLKLISIELVMPSNHLILCHPLLLLPSIFPIIRIFSNESVFCINWPPFAKVELQHQHRSFQWIFRTHFL